ncbi:MAG TPA: DUF429 domain-containing protein [Burkholderiales bacterium]|nr:DUF429 domain-containing protein [Burkholderiales bacterium]
MRIHGVDFTCAPRAAKPITAACAVLQNTVLKIERVEGLATFAEFEALLARRGPWVGGFDFPFSLPRELIRDLGWPTDWPKLVAHCGTFDRLRFRAALDAYRNTRQPGNRYAHRATDHPAGSSSPMKLVNPPVALMFHEGARRLLASGAHLPALHDGDRTRVALEAYPGLVVRKQLGIRDSYKSDTRADQTPARRRVRKRIVEALKAGKPLGIRLRCATGLERALVADGAGDLLDAAICAVQAAWASQQPRYGIPADAPAGEGWIVSAQGTLKKRRIVVPAKAGTRLSD